MSTSRGQRISYQNGARIVSEIQNHRWSSGATTSLIVGAKGSGKTTFLLNLAGSVMCENPFTHTDEKETVIWRGRPEDTVNWLPKDILVIFLHIKDYRTTKFYDEFRREIPRSQLPPIEKYTSFTSLKSRLRAGKVNIIFEPHFYDVSENLKNIIRKRGMTNEDIWKNVVDSDNTIWWFEFLQYLRLRKNEKFITIIWDEAGEILSPSPGGAKWHLNLWIKSIMQTLRKKRISLVCACHSKSDIDGRLFPMFMVKGYMKGAITPSSSLINHLAPVMLPTGHMLIERDSWGKIKCNKIPEQTVINTILHPELNDDGFDDTECDEEIPGPVSLDTTHPKSSQIAPSEFVSIKGSELLRAEK
jgi:DNA polymerase III delta prime subunit